MGKAEMPKRGGSCGGVNPPPGLDTTFIHESQVSIPSWSLGVPPDPDTCPAPLHTHTQHPCGSIQQDLPKQDPGRKVLGAPGRTGKDVGTGEGRRQVQTARGGNAPDQDILVHTLGWFPAPPENVAQPDCWDGQGTGRGQAGDGQDTPSASLHTQQRPNPTGAALGCRNTPKAISRAGGLSVGTGMCCPMEAGPVQPAHGATTVMGARCPPCPKTSSLGLTVTAPTAIATPCPQALLQALPRQRWEPTEAIPGGIPRGNRDQPVPPPQGRVLPVPRLCSVAAEPMPPHGTGQHHRDHKDPAAPPCSEPWGVPVTPLQLPGPHLSQLCLGTPLGSLFAMGESSARSRLAPGAASLEGPHLAPGSPLTPGVPTCQRVPACTQFLITPMVHTYFGVPPCPTVQHHLRVPTCCGVPAHPRVLHCPRVPTRFGAPPASGRCITPKSPLVLESLLTPGLSITP